MPIADYRWLTKNDPREPLARCHFFGAVSAETARPLAELNPHRNPEWDRLVWGGTILEAAAGQYYAPSLTAEQDDAGRQFLQQRPVRLAAAILLGLAVVVAGYRLLSG
ncbi:MAG: hypothetical protein ABJE47_22255 [bacterium]